MRIHILGANDIAGVFFFSLNLFGFSCLSVIGLFASERLLYMRERCESRSVILSSLRLIINQGKRILFFFYIFLIKGIDIVIVLSLFRLIVLSGSIRHHPPSCRAASGLRRDRIQTRRARAGSSDVLEVPSRPRPIQSRNR